jgi:hypothetical protein
MQNGRINGTVEEHIIIFPGRGGVGFFWKLLLKNYASVTNY